MSLLRAFASTFHIALVLLTISRWMNSIISHWEDVEKELTPFEKSFTHFRDFYTRYWYILACVWFLVSLMGLVTNFRRAAQKSEKWV